MAEGVWSDRLPSAHLNVEVSWLVRHGSIPFIVRLGQLWTGSFRLLVEAAAGQAPAGALTVNGAFKF